MKLKSFLTLVLAALTVVVSAQSLSPSTKWHWDKGTIVVETPERPAGQQHVIGLTAPKLETVRVAFVGLGMRGPWAVMRFCHTVEALAKNGHGLTNLLFVETGAYIELDSHQGLLQSDTCYRILKGKQPFVVAQCLVGTSGRFVDLITLMM